MVTTDGHRLAYVETAIDDKEGEMDTLIPKKALLELVKLSRADGEVSFGEDTNHIYFQVEGRLLITRKLSGQFPNYEMVMPKDNDHLATFDLEEMRSCIRRMSFIADERNRSIRLTVREGEIEVTAQSSEEGEGREIVQAEYTGEEVQLGFNWQYLLEFLSNAATAEIAAEAIEAGEPAASSSDDGAAAGTATARESRPPQRVNFEFKDSNAQTQLSIADEATYDYKYIVMPLRI
jgi:DNA polymerase-3 subunit beta